MVISEVNRIENMQSESVVVACGKNCVDASVVLSSFLLEAHWIISFSPLVGTIDAA
jgi:hypothetical protein